jgi:hypothetical protein
MLSNVSFFSQKDYETRLNLFNQLKKEGILINDARKPKLLDTPIHILEIFRDHPLVTFVEEAITQYKFKPSFP